MVIQDIAFLFPRLKLFAWRTDPGALRTGGRVSAPAAKPAGSQAPQGDLLPRRVPPAASAHPVPEEGSPHRVCTPRPRGGSPRVACAHPVPEKGHPTACAHSGPGRGPPAACAHPARGLQKCPPRGEGTAGGLLLC